MILQLLNGFQSVLNDELMEQFCRILEKEIGLFYSKTRWRELEKKLVSISASCGFEDKAKCLEWLINGPLNKEKLDILTSYLTVGETYFFRDKQLFANLEHEVLPDIVHRHQKDRSIRIWSAGCCTGEEPYSIAIALSRLLPNIADWKVSILGSDINPEFLLKAEKAQYKKWSFRTTPPEVIEKYFKKNNDATFSLIPEIKKMVTFKQFNLVSGTYSDIKQGINEMDLVLCHNVLIYFSENQIKTTVHKLTESVCKNGWLSVSAIEAPFISELSLNAHRYPGSIFFKKEPPKKNSHQKVYSAPVHETSHLKKKSQVLDRPPAEVIIKKHTHSKKNETIYEECLLLTKRKSYIEVISLLELLLIPLLNIPTDLKEHSKEVNLLIRTYANQGNLNSALEWIEKALLADSLDPSLHYLHATLLQEQGNISEAIKSVKRALFIDSNFIMAYILLGILEKDQGNSKAALRNFKTASDLIDKHSPEENISNGEGFNIEYLKDLILNNIKNL